MVGIIRGIAVLLALVETLGLVGAWWVKRSRKPSDTSSWDSAWPPTPGLSELGRNFPASTTRVGGSSPFGDSWEETPARPHANRSGLYLVVVLATWAVTAALFVIPLGGSKQKHLPTGTVIAHASPEVQETPDTARRGTISPAPAETAPPTLTDTPTEFPTSASTPVPTPTLSPPTPVPSATGEPVLAAATEDSRVMALSYDANSNIKTRVDAAGNQIVYDYDALNRLTAVAYPDGSSVRYSYDVLNQLTDMTDRLGTTSYAYDIHGRITHVTNVNRRTLSYRYDPRGLLAEMTYPNGASVRYTRDDNGWLISARDSEAGEIRYTYDLGGRLTERTLPNGVVTRFEYNAANFLSAIRHSTPDGASLLELVYVFDANGNCTQVTRTIPGQPPQVTRYTYDAAQRLIGVTYPDGETVTYEYDAGGDRTAMTSSTQGTTRYSYDSFGQLVTLQNAQGQTRFEYDPYGSLMRRQDPTGRVITYTWDYENRLIAVEDGTNRVQFSYDGEGRRLSKTVNGRTTEYVQQGIGWPQVLQTASDSTARVLAGLTQVGEIGSNRSVYYLEDGLGSVIGLTDANGQLIGTREYDAFGLPRSTEDWPAVLAFAGEEMDSATGLIFLRARYYDPALGRFLSADPTPLTLGETQAMNRYVYARNNPVNRTDPLGLQDGPSISPPNLLGLIKAIFDRSWFGWAGVDFSVNTRGMMNFRINFLQVGAIISAANIQFSIPAPGRIENPQNWAEKAYNVTQGWLTVIMAPYMVPGFSLASERQTIVNSFFNIFQNNTPTSSSIRYVDFSDDLTPDLSDAGFGIVIPPSGCSLRYATCVYVPTFLPSFNPDVSSDPVVRKYGYPQLGGVDLSRSAEVMVNLNEITGAVFDPEIGQLVLTGRQNLALPPMNMDDLAVAIRTIYGGQMPTMSIEPCQADVHNGCMRVHYNDRFAADPTAATPEWVTYNTASQLAPADTPATWNNHFGWVIFEADRYLKTASLGMDNLTGQPFQSSVPGYADLFELNARHTTGANGQVDLDDHCRILTEADRMRPSRCYRLWFEPGEMVVRTSEDGRAMTFETVTITTEARFVRFEPSGQMVDVPGNDPAVDEFVNFFNAHYMEFAQEKPELAELVQLAKITGIVWWLRENNLPVDLGWLDRYEVLPIDTPLSTKAISVQTDLPNSPLELYGGVDLGKRPIYQPDPIMDQFATDALEARPSATDLMWSFDYEGETQQAVALSLAPAAIIGGFHLSQTDVFLPMGGQLTAEFTRTYNSLDPAPSPYGRGWSLDIPRLVSRHRPIPGEPDSYYPELVLTDGATTITFALSLDGAFIPSDTAAETQVLGLTGEDPFAPGRLPEGWTLEVNWPGEPIGLYDADHNPVSYSGFALVSGDMTYTFNTSGQMTGVRDRAGNQITYTYAGEMLVAIANQDGYGINFAYDSDQMLRSLATTDGHTWNYEYGPGGELTQVTDGEGIPINVYRYDEQWRLIQIEDGSGHILATSDYDDLGRSTSDGALEIAYPDPHVVTYTTPDGYQVTRHYNAQGQIEQETDSMGRMRAFSYDEQNRLIGYTDYLGHETTITRDEWGFVTAITGSQGEPTRFLSHDSYGQPLMIVDAENNLTLLKTDDQGRITEVQTGLQMGDVLPDSVTYTPVDPLTTSYHYNLAGQMDAIRDPSGLTTQVAYDPIGNLSSIQLPGGASLSTTFDGRARLTAMIDSSGNMTAFSYDSQERLMTMTMPGDRTYQYHYTDGLLTGLTYPNGETMTYRYNQKEQLIAVVDSVGAAATYQYNRQGQIVLIQPPVGGAIRFTYDELGRLIQQQQSSGAYPSSIDQMQPATRSVIQMVNSLDWPDFQRKVAHYVVARQ